MNNPFADLDLRIKVIDYNQNKYIVDPKGPWQLVFGFEDWSGIIDDGKSHIKITAYYRNSEGCNLVKWQNEDLDELIAEIKEWNNENRI